VRGGICILPLFLLSTLILNVPPVLLWAFAPHSRVDSLLSTKERLSVLLSTEERLTYLVLLSTGERLVLLSTGERLWFVLLSTGERLVLLSTGERLWFACCNALGS
jgi:hypothetical protein